MRYFNKNKPIFRKLTNTFRNKKKIISLSIEGQLWKDAGFNYDDTVIIRYISKGKILIENFYLYDKLMRKSKQ